MHKLRVGTGSAFLAVLLAAIVVASVSAEVTGAATPKKSYWTEEKAEAVAATIRVHYCIVVPSDPKCADYPAFKPKIGFYTPEEVECRGADELRDTFAFSRFICKFVLGYESRESGLYVQMASGRLRLDPAGRAKFRWKLVSIARRFG